MNHSESGRTQGRRRPRAAFADFGADPFLMMGGSSIFDDFFSRDPFDDPFFTRPMGMGPGLLGGGFLHRGGLFGMGMDSLFDRSAFVTRPDGLFIDQQPFQPPRSQPEARRGPVIEELIDDAEEGTDSKAENGQDPIVEHPDDEAGGSALQGLEACRRTPNVQALSSNFLRRPSNGHQSSSTYQSYSFQSSSMSFGGSGGSFYSSSSMKRVGPDGVMQEEHMERDLTGKETRTSARGLWDQVHAVTKKRNTSLGPETTVETLRNLTPEEAPQFNTQWEANAQRSLPGWSRGHMRAIDGNQRSNRQTWPALPYQDDAYQQRMPRH